MAGYAEHVVVCTGKDDWLSKIEDENSGDNLAADLKELFGRGGKYTDVSEVKMEAGSAWVGTTELMRYIWTAVSPHFCHQLFVSELGASPKGNPVNICLPATVLQIRPFPTARVI